MRLTDLSPVWIYKRKVFAFLCPHCRTMWLTCKSVVMGSRQQFQIIEAYFGQSIGGQIVSCKVDEAWRISGEDFSTMSVHPSLDASKSGHWHGHITNGSIVGGI